MRHKQQVVFFLFGPFFRTSSNLPYSLIFICSYFSLFFWFILLFLSSSLFPSHLLHLSSLHSILVTPFSSLHSLLFSSLFFSSLLSAHFSSLLSVLFFTISSLLFAPILSSPLFFFFLLFSFSYLERLDKRFCCQLLTCLFLQQKHK